MGRNFTIFALFYFVFKSKFHVQAPWGAYIQRGDLTEGFLRYDFEGLIFGILQYFQLKFVFSQFTSSSYLICGFFFPPFASVSHFNNNIPHDVENHSRLFQTK